MVLESSSKLCLDVELFPARRIGVQCDQGAFVAATEASSDASLIVTVLEVYLIASRNSLTCCERLVWETLICTLVKSISFTAVYRVSEGSASPYTPSVCTRLYYWHLKLFVVVQHSTCLCNSMLFWYLNGSRALSRSCYFWPQDSAAIDRSFVWAYKLSQWCHGGDDTAKVKSPKLNPYLI